MQFLKLLKKHLISSQLFVAFVGTLLAVFFMLEQNLFRFPTAILIFITYFSGYLYTKYQQHRFFPIILGFNFVCGVFCALLILANHHELRLLKWAVIVILGLLYNSSFLEKHIRQIPLLKAFSVGITWALINSWLPVPGFSPEIFLVTMLFVTALVLPFDIRDMKEDTVLTFPRLIGVQKTKYLAYILIFMGQILAALSFKTEFSLAFFLASAVATVFIYASENDHKDSYFSVGVESCSGLPLLFLVLMKYF